MKTICSASLIALCLATLGGCASNAADEQSPPPPAPIELKVGDTAPGFALRDQENKEHRLERYQGKVVVLAFYPADMTKGCTIQAHKLSQIAPDLEKLNVQLFGISVQDVASKKQFCEKEGIEYTLLADAEKHVSQVYGVLSSRGVANRVTFVITPDGKIGAIQKNVNPITADKDTLAMVDEVTKQVSVTPIAAADLKKEITARKGKVVLVNFWATWCPPCVKEFPELVKLREQYSGKGLEILFVSADDREELSTKVLPFLQKNNATFQTWILGEDEEAFANEFDPELKGALALPHTYLYDKAGKRVLSLDEEKTFAEFEKLIKPLL